MEEFMQNIDSLSDTAALEELLFAIMYWVAVIVVMLFIFYLSVRITNKVRAWKRKEPKKNRDDFID
jgi:heme/copper-type cytochrome/quinol oxidase subunit 2